MNKYHLQVVRLKHHQCGAALILFFLALLMTGTIFFVASIAVDKGRIEADKETTQALAKAKEALIAHAASFYERGNQGLYGFLPCPELATSSETGNQQGNCTGKSVNSIGRFPWRSLDLQPLKDSSGECLWYAVTGEFKAGNFNPNPPPPPSTRSEMLNDDSVGLFRVLEESGSVINGNTPEDRVVAVIIAPGKALQGQVRPGVADSNNVPPCNVSPDVANPAIAQYLDNFNGVNNSDVNNTADATPDDFITTTNRDNPNLNDRIATVTAGEIFDAIKAQGNNFQDRMDLLTQALAECLAQYGLNNPGSGSGGGVCPGGNRNSCRNLCDDTWRACGNQCDADRAACLAAGGRANVCNAQRNNCNDQCRDARFACRDSCDANCGSGGGGGPDFRLPWPASVNLGVSDYRLDTSYVEVTNTNLGRFPFDVSQANASTSNPGTAELLNKTYCDAATIGIDSDSDGVADVDLQAATSEYRLLWKNWKDHFFYALSSDFNLNATTPTVCSGNCLLVNSGATNYAAIVFFSGERLTNLNQRRLARPQESAAPPFTDSKADITNYLEGDNIDGDTDFQTGASSNTFNDRAFCIDASMNVTVCP